MSLVDFSSMHLFLIHLRSLDKVRNTDARYASGAKRVTGCCAVVWCSAILPPSSLPDNHPH